MGHHIVALSGGWDSTAMALRLAEMGGQNYRYICTPTGNELPSMVRHWCKLEEAIEAPLERLPGIGLEDLMQQWNALPNWRQRWCTRLLKIQPCLAYLTKLAAGAGGKPVLYVGLRADEPERKGLYSEHVETRFPLREWGWGRADVVSYVRSKGIVVPNRTDCAWCYGQRLIEWFQLWRDERELYNRAIEWEKRTCHTFRSPQRDSWPTSLTDLGQAFEQGRRPPGYKRQMSLELSLREDDGGACRVCRL